jgi:hypothetical protein|tara:strand:- start:430 stop:897 length:468 start_codon:yes stop_codon:yes gene_type:complete
MSKQEEREKNIFSKVNFEKLPFKVDKNNWKTFGTNISIFLHQVFKLRVTKEPLNWCFANIKRIKIFLQIFHANESGSEIYKEEIAKNIPEYSYKTIAKIIDDGIAQGYYVLLAPDGEIGNDGKVKNIRPSEELATDFLNLCIEIVSYRDTKLPKL